MSSEPYRTPGEMPRAYAGTRCATCGEPLHRELICYSDACEMVCLDCMRSERDATAAGQRVVDTSSAWSTARYALVLFLCIVGYHALTRSAQLAALGMALFGWGVFRALRR